MNGAPLVVFICSGNICRSPMAQAIAAATARSLGIDVRVASAGTAALLGHPIHDMARDALTAIGMPLDMHEARAISRELIYEAALVVAVTRRHRDDLRRFFPAQRSKIVSFDEITGLGDIDDPFGGGGADFDRTADVLRRGMPDVLEAATREPRA